MTTKPVPKHSVCILPDAPNDIKPIRIDEGIFAGTIYHYAAVNVSDDDGRAQLNYTTNFFRVVINGIDIELSENENMNIVDMIGEQLANDLYENYISPIIIDIIELQIRLEQENSNG